MGNSRGKNMAREYKDLKQEKGFFKRTGFRAKAEIPPEELDLKIREDRIGRYFTKYLNKFVFAEFSEEFLKKFKAADIMRGVPVPLRKQDIKDFNGGEGTNMLHIAENMAWVIGCNPHFKYTQSYVDCLDELFGSKIIEGVLKEGRDIAETEDYDNACIHFRACLVMQPNYLHAMYSYARACTKMYENSNNKEFVGRMKAEALDFYEMTSILYPRHANSYYYLGYAYLNMGQYIKARLAWQDYLRISKNGKDKREINQRIKQIENPVIIEEGTNDILAGRNEEGLRKLTPYMDSQYVKWWPLHYYIGVGLERTGDTEGAIERFKQVLKLNGSHLETMEELYAIYSAQGDTQNATKYKKKMDMIRKQLEEEAKEIAESDAQNDLRTGIKTSDALDKERTLAPEEKIVKRGTEVQEKIAAIKAEREASMDNELAEALKKRSQETGAKRPTKRLDKK